MICVLFVICIYVRAPWENSSCELNGLPYEFINNNNNNNKKKIYMLITGCLAQIPKRRQMICF